MVEELTVYDAQDVADLDGLMHDLSPTSFCNEVILDKVMKDENAHVYVIREDSHYRYWNALRDAYFRVYHCWCRICCG